MTFLNTWVQTEVAKALGWTLLHSLWEGAVAAAALAIVLGIARTSAVRYGAACVAMLGLLAGFGVTFYRAMPWDSGAGLAHVHNLPEAVVPLADDASAATIHTRWDVSDLLPWLAPLWMAGVLLFQLRCLASWMAAGRLRRFGVCGAPVAWTEKLDVLRARLRLNRRVILLESYLAEVPVVIGHLRPAILMPVGLLAQLPMGQIESILLHELAHIRRADYLVNLMQTLVEGLLFYHPAAWWISHVIRTERENCCDDLVVAANVDAHEYATALAALAEHRWSMRDAALAATGGHLVNRIRRLLARGEGPRPAMAPAVSAGVLILSFALALAAWQTPAQNAPAIVPVIPVAQAPELSQKAAALAPVQSPTPVAKPVESVDKSMADRLREAMKLAAGRHPTTMLLAQNERGPLADPALAPYWKWLNEEVVYIITKEERAAFLTIRTEDERNMFIKQFWMRRDPAYPAAPPGEYPVIPKGNPENDFKKEHYRRLAYVNDRFGTKLPGWKTDRGRIYIQYGPPDEIESHPSGGKYTRPPEEGGGETTTYPFEQWMYRYIEGIGKNVIVEFVDTTRTGEYRLTKDPSGKVVKSNEQELAVAGGGGRGGSAKGVLPMKMQVTYATTYATATQSVVLTQITVQFDTKDLQFKTENNISTATINVYGRISTLAGRPLAPFEDVVRVTQPPLQPDANPHRTYQKTLPLQPGTYRLNIAAKDIGSGNSGTSETVFEVPAAAQ